LLIEEGVKRMSATQPAHIRNKNKKTEQKKLKGERAVNVSRKTPYDVRQEKEWRRILSRITVFV
jgi:hypothetical protein